MRILIVTAPFKAHLYVQAPLASALRTAGHQVRIAAPPEMAGDIASAGLVGVAIGESAELSPRMVSAEPPVARRSAASRAGRPTTSRQSDYGRPDPVAELESNVMGWRTLFNLDSAFHDTISFARQWQPDLIISDTFTFTGSVAARVIGSAHLRMLFGADGLGQLYLQCQQVWKLKHEDDRADPLRQWLEPILHDYGQSFDQQVVLGQHTLMPMPPWIWRPQGIDYLPMRHIAFNGPGQAERWMYERPRRRRVCMSLGLSHREGRFGVVASARALFEAVEDLDVEVVATLNAEQLQSADRIPDNVRVMDFAPLNVLLPHCSAIVHSGGSGTFAAALEHAVPQLLVPNVYWSEKWWGPVAMGNGVEAEGIGRYVCDADELTGENLRAALVDVLSDERYAQHAARVQQDYSTLPSPNEMAPLLERLAAEGADPTAQDGRVGGGSR